MASPVGIRGRRSAMRASPSARAPPIRIGQKPPPEKKNARRGREAFEVSKTWSFSPIFPSAGGVPSPLLLPSLHARLRGAGWSRTGSLVSGLPADVVAALPGDRHPGAHGGAAASWVIAGIPRPTQDGPRPAERLDAARLCRNAPFPPRRCSAGRASRPGSSASSAFCRSGFPWSARGRRSPSSASPPPSTASSSASRSRTQKPCSPIRA